MEQEAIKKAKREALSSLLVKLKATEEIQEKIESLQTEKQSFFSLNKDTTKLETQIAIFTEYGEGIEKAVATLTECRTDEKKPITEVDVSAFYVECKRLAHQAKKQLNDERTLGTIILDSLNKIFNLCLTIISFFKRKPLRLFTTTTTLIEKTHVSAKEIRKGLEQFLLEHGPIPYDVETSEPEPKIKPEPDAQPDTDDTMQDDSKSPCSANFS